MELMTTENYYVQDTAYSMRHTHGPLEVQTQLLFHV